VSVEIPTQGQTFDSSLSHTAHSSRQLVIFVDLEGLRVGQIENALNNGVALPLNRGLAHACSQSFSSF
jgi:hypothetical protein